MFTKPVHIVVSVAVYLCTAALQLPCAASSSDNWWDGFAAPPAGEGMDGMVYTLAVYNGELVAGGFFTRGGDNTCAKHVARFNGTRWKRFACGTDGPVSALLAIGSDLYVGGSFGLAGPAVVNNVARWDGSSWHAVGMEINGQVYTLAKYGVDIVAGGSFDQSDGSPGNLVARWDGSAWQAMAQGLVGKWVLALAEFDGHLYAGGTFTEADGNPAGNIARWDGTGWDAFGTAITGVGSGWAWDVETLSTEYNGNLIVGGDFSHVNGVYMNGLAEWDGVSWTALGTGLSDGAGILDVSVYNGDLVAFGYFFLPDESYGVARWNGMEWLGFGSGYDWLYPFGGPGAAEVFGDELYVGGNIASAGQYASAYIARWSDAGPTGVSMTHTTASGLELLPAYPNPFRVETTFTYGITDRANVDVSIFDASGRLVAVLLRDAVGPGTHTGRWSGRDHEGDRVAAGVYFLRLAADHDVLSQQVVLTR